MIDSLGRVQKVLVIGGTSAIGIATLRSLAARHALDTVVLVGRPGSALDAVAHELRNSLAPATVSVAHVDLVDPAASMAKAREVFASTEFDVVVLSAGVLFDNRAVAVDPASGVEMATVNYLSQMAIGTVALREMEKQGFGVLVVISSVAGERTRADNYVYGSTKAALDGWASGAADALANGPVRVLIVRPGMVRTRMSAGLPEAPLTVDADAVGEAVADNLLHGPTVVWVPGALRWVMAVLRHLPRPVFRLLSARSRG